VFSFAVEAAKLILSLPIRFVWLSSSSTSDGTQGLMNCGSVIVIGLNHNFSKRVAILKALSLNPVMDDVAEMGTRTSHKGGSLGEVQDFGDDPALRSTGTATG
jgi:hypothetical protein